MSAKIATCCYCGTRAALVLKDMPGGRHELACAACGAPLHEMKAIPSAHPPGEVHGTVPASRVRGTRPPKTGKSKPAKPRKRKRKGGGIAFGAWLLKEVIDEIEDIFD